MYESRGQCYDHYFGRFLPLFGEQTGDVFKYQHYDDFSAQTAVF
jgi:hypothetical protein